MKTRLIGAVLLLLLTVPLQALECIDIPVKTAMDRDGIVLLGRIEAVRFATIAKDRASHNIVTVRVTQLWKGLTPTVIELHQPFVGGGMDFWQSVGRDFVLFVRVITPERPLRTIPPIVSGFSAAECISKPAESYDLKAFGKSYAPQP